MKLSEDPNKQPVEKLCLKHGVSVTGDSLSYYKKPGDKKGVYGIGAGFVFGRTYWFNF